MKIAPLFYLEHLTDDAIQAHMCSDRIWLPRAIFEEIAGNMTEPGEFHVIQLTNGVGQRVVGTPYQPHHNSNSDTIYVPSWMLNQLEYDTDNITYERIIPGLLTRMTILPYTSEHCEADDPVTALRNAFEHYGCVTTGSTIPLLLPGGVHLTVDIHNTEPKSNVPLCIRSGTIELELLRPLDRPDTPPPPAVLLPEPAVLLPEPVPVVEHIPSIVTTIPVDRETMRQRMLDAARRRLEASKIDTP